VNKWSLEDLELYLEVGCVSVSNQLTDTIVEGLYLEGAKCVEMGSVELSEDSKFKLPSSKLSWKLRSSSPSSNYQLFPLYLNESRSTLVAEVLLAVPQSIPRHIWAQRGVALVLQSARL
jgi:hypothetical protein